MSEQEVLAKKQFQEVQYQLPYHWMLKGSAIPVYESRHRLIVSMIKNLPGEKKTALDLGCGDGKNTYELQKSFGRDITFCGIDFSEKAIAFAKLIAEGIDFRVQDAAHVDFPDSSFDVVVCIEVIEHIHPEEIPVFLAEIRRVLAPGGGIVITTPTTNQKLNEKHYQHFTEAKLTGLLRAAGFAISEVEGIGMTLPPFVNKLYKYLLSIPGLWRISAYVGGKVLPAAKAGTIVVSALKAG